MLGKIKGEVGLLERHLSVMRVVARNGPIGIMKLTEELGQPQHRIRYSLRVLEQMQYIKVKATPAGAIAMPNAYNSRNILMRSWRTLILHLAALHQDKSISKS